MAEDKKVLAARAAQQAKNAAQNSGRAVEAAAEEAVDAVTPKSEYKAQLIQGFVLLGVSFVAGALSSKKLIDANKTNLIETARAEGIEVITMHSRGRKVG